MKTGSEPLLASDKVVESFTDYDTQADTDSEGLISKSNIIHDYTCKNVHDHRRNTLCAKVAIFAEFYYDLITYKISLSKECCKMYIIYNEI